MSRIYTVSASFTLTNAGGDCDLLEIIPADDKPVRLRGFCLSQTSEVQDAAEENLRISVIRLPATVTNGSGGTTPTPQPLDSADAAAGATAHVNDTTVATTSGTAITLEELGWNERNTPFEKWYPEDRYCPIVKQGEALIIRNQTTAADDLTAQITAWIEEM